MVTPVSREAETSDRIFACKVWVDVGVVLVSSIAGFALGYVQSDKAFRISTYQMLAGLFSSLLGFVVAAATIAITIKPANTATKEGLSTYWAPFKSGMVGLFIAAITSIVASIISTVGTSTGAVCATTFVSMAVFGYGVSSMAFVILAVRALIDSHSKAHGK